MKQGLAPFTPRIDPALQCRWDRCASFCFVEKKLGYTRAPFRVERRARVGLSPAPLGGQAVPPFVLTTPPQWLGVGALGGVDEFRGTRETSSKCGLLKKPACAVLPGSPRGPGEPCHPTGVPAHNPVKLTTRLSSRTRVPTIKPPPPGTLTNSCGRTEAGDLVVRIQLFGKAFWHVLGSSPRQNGAP